MNVQHAFERDLRTLEVMVSEVSDYLDSKATHWTLAVPDMPKLTLGGCLMRMHRLCALSSNLSQEQKDRLEKAVAEFEATLPEAIVRFEVRAHQELHDRLSEWSSYLRHMRGRHASSPEYYARVVDTRVVIGRLITKLSQRPYHLEKQVPRELDQFDRHLRNAWEEGEFVWPNYWQPVYPIDPFWYLYGSPRGSGRFST